MNISDTLAAREKTHGKFTEHAELSQLLQDTLRSHAGWDALEADQKESLQMIMHKISRIMNGNPNFHDAWHDITGYSKLVADRLEQFQ